MDKGKKAKLVEYIYGVTAEYVKSLQPAKGNEKAKALADLVVGKFGCYEDATIKLVSALSGEDLAPFKKPKRNSVPEKSAMVLTENYAGAMAGEIVIVRGSDADVVVGITPDGVNNSRHFSRAVLRPATRKQIAAGLTDAAIKSFVDNYNVILI